MTDPNKSHITIVIDRSGSMNSIRTDAEGAINTFIADQKAEPLPCTLLLNDFDAGSVDWYRVVFDGDLQAAPPYTLVPRGTTALYDAIGKGIGDTGARLAAMPEHERPGHVYFVIQTDGLENASREWDSAKVIEAIKKHESEFSWTFIFLGAGKDAWAQSQAFAGTQMRGANTVSHSGSAMDYHVAYASSSNTMRASRRGEQVKGFAAKIEDGKIEEPDQEPA